MLSTRAAATGGLAALVLAASCTTGGIREAPPPATDQAVVAGWLRDARELERRGRFDLAAARIERALRVEPGNPHLWHELARVHMAQGQFDQAIQFARKSNTLAADDGLEASNRALIETALSRRDAGKTPAGQ